jgi:hypothetical protein
MAYTGKSTAALAIVLGLWALLMAGSMTFSAVAPPAPEVQAYKLPATVPVKETIEEHCACIFAGDCGGKAPSAG